MPSYLSYKNNLRVSLDAKDDNIESWITVRGNHIPIMKGQSKEEAVKSFLEHQAGKNDVPQGVKWTPTNKKGEGTGNKQTPKKEKYNIQHGARISDIESMINSYADNKAYSSWEEEEQFIAEKLKQEGIYAYGNQIKEAMKNVYGEEYEDAFKIKTPENSKEDIAKMAKSQQKDIPEEVGFGALEIAYNDVKFGSNSDTNKKLLLNAIHESGHEEEKAMAKLVEGMPADNFKSAETFRKALENKPMSIAETEKMIENFFAENTEKVSARGVEKEYNLLKKQVSNIEKVLKENRRQQQSIPVGAATFSNLNKLRKEEDRLIKQLRDAQKELDDFIFYEMS